METHVRQPLDPRAIRTARATSPRAARDRGVTLIETMVVVTIVGILLVTAVPRFSQLLSNQRASAATNDLLHGIALARSEALKRGRRVYLAPKGDRWRDGWVVFVDGNDDRRFDDASSGSGDVRIAQHDAMPASIAMTNPANLSHEPFTDVGSPRRPYILFDGHGYPRQRNGAFNAGSVVVTDRTGDTISQRTICLASSGRVRVVVARAGCG